MVTRSTLRLATIWVRRLMILAHLVIKWGTARAFRIRLAARRGRVVLAMGACCHRGSAGRAIVIASLDVVCRTGCARGVCRARPSVEVMC